MWLFNLIIDVMYELHRNDDDVQREKIAKMFRYKYITFCCGQCYVT